MSKKNEILNQLINLLKKLCPKQNIDYDSIRMETKLIEDLGFTSIDVLMMAIGIEKEFDIEINNANPSMFVTVQNVVDYIDGKQDD
ncbi:MAG: phosphopantetheine-binding protein [Bacilli bacterium]|nr:phosphopantetheine-binding protein [Bacilli bacterium]